jgi:hypothetical protein
MQKPHLPIILIVAAGLPFAYLWYQKQQNSRKPVTYANPAGNSLAVFSDYWDDDQRPLANPLAAMLSNRNLMVSYVDHLPVDQSAIEKTLESLEQGACILDLGPGLMAAGFSLGEIREALDQLIAACHARSSLVILTLTSWTSAADNLRLTLEGTASTRSVLFVTLQTPDRAEADPSSESGQGPAIRWFSELILKVSGYYSL